MPISDTRRTCTVTSLLAILRLVLTPHLPASPLMEIKRKARSWPSPERKPVKSLATFRESSIKKTFYWRNWGRSIAQNLGLSCNCKYQNIDDLTLSLVHWDYTVILSFAVIYALIWFGFAPLYFEFRIVICSIYDFLYTLSFYVIHYLQ